MRKAAFLLAVHAAVFSTQPAWQGLAMWLSGGECGGGSMVCELMQACQPPAPAEEEGSSEPKECCPPFTCCFPCCVEVVQVQELVFQLFLKKNTRPSEGSKVLLSQCAGECFHPPEAA